MSGPICFTLVLPKPFTANNSAVLVGLIFTNSTIVLVGNTMNPVVLFSAAISSRHLVRALYKSSRGPPSRLPPPDAPVPALSSCLRAGLKSSSAWLRACRKPSASKPSTHRSKLLSLLNSSFSNSSMISSNTSRTALLSASVGALRSRGIRSSASSVLK